VTNVIANEIARRGEERYDRDLKADLERTHPGAFVSIDPESGQFFVANTFEAAIAGARRSQPGRLTYTRRIGFPSAVEIGCCP
jgi:hypothetical protein